MNNLEFVRKIAEESRDELEALRRQIVITASTARDLDSVNIWLDVFKDDPITLMKMKDRMYHEFFKDK